jgi:hypothetical protein
MPTPAITSLAAKVSDLVIAGGLAGQLQTVQRAFAGQILIRIPLARQDRRRLVLDQQGRAAVAGH